LGTPVLSAAVDSNFWPQEFAYEPKNLVGLRVPTGLGFGVDQVVVDLDVEDAFVSGYQGELVDQVLVGTENLICHAHGAVGIVSRYAVCDGDTQA